MVRLQHNMSELLKYSFKSASLPMTFLLSFLSIFFSNLRMKERGRGSTFVVSKHKKTHGTSHSREIRIHIKRLTIKNRSNNRVTELSSDQNIPIIIYP